MANLGSEGQEVDFDEDTMDEELRELV